MVLMISVKVSLSAGVCSLRLKYRWVNLEMACHAIFEFSPDIMLAVFRHVLQNKNILDYSGGLFFWVIVYVTKKKWHILSWFLCCDLGRLNGILLENSYSMHTAMDWILHFLNAGFSLWLITSFIWVILFFFCVSSFQRILFLLLDTLTLEFLFYSCSLDI